ncbi:hypothetical protein [Kitasatospora sp. NPDC093102]|uniref:hypothetical protein n=1 Tax=Kitasatospora sp. NPDC093102 TaxID=3155069 RepID=UPI0034144CDD
MTVDPAVRSTGSACPSDAVPALAQLRALAELGLEPLWPAHCDVRAAAYAALGRTVPETAPAAGQSEPDLLSDQVGVVLGLLGRDGTLRAAPRRPGAPVVLVELDGGYLASRPATRRERRDARAFATGLDATAGTDGPAARELLGLAEALLLARELPGLKQAGTEAAEAVERALAGPGAVSVALDDHALAALLGDAETLTRALATEGPATARDRAVREVELAAKAAPRWLRGAAPAEAAAAAGAVAWMRHLAGALAAPEHLAGVEAALRRLGSVVEGGGTAGRPAAELLAGVADGRLPRLAHRLELVERARPRARTAARVRAAVSALERHRDARGGELLRLAVRLAEGSAAEAIGEAEARRLRHRLTASGGRNRADALTAALVGAARTGDRTEPVLPRPPAPELLAWFRTVLHPDLHTAEFERPRAEWLGPDRFGLRELPPPPPYLAELDIAAVPPEQLAPLFRRLSMTRPAPEAADLAPEVLATEAGQVARARRTPEQRRWGRRTAPEAPPLPESVEIPLIAHGVWLGKPMPATTGFWRNFGDGARRYRGEAQFVLWLDIPRERFDGARATPRPDSGPDPYQDVREQLEWAEANGIALVNLHEVFHAGHPPKLHASIVLEMCKQVPRGFAAASDHLRVELIERFGGIYLDGDNAFVAPEDGPEPAGSLPELARSVAGSPHAFTLNPLPGVGIANDIFIAPARHPFASLWVECARLNYFRSQPEIFGGLDKMAREYVGQVHAGLRYIAPSRSGRVHHAALRYAGIDPAELTLTSSAIRHGSECSWIPPRTGEPAVAPRAAGADPTPQVLRRLLAFLEWQLTARDGNLYLSAADPVIRGLPDPEAAWVALLRAIDELGVGRRVTSVTDLRRNDDGVLEQVALPPEANRLLVRWSRPGRWLGDTHQGRPGRPAWLLDEAVVPASMPGRAHPSAGPEEHREQPYVELLRDGWGAPLGLWFRPPESCDPHANAARFHCLPPGHAAVHLGSRAGGGWLGELNLSAEQIAEYLGRYLLLGRPVLLTVPRGGLEHSGPLAERLAQVVRRPVRLLHSPTLPQGATARFRRRLATEHRSELWLDHGEPRWEDGVEYREFLPG